MVDLVYHPDSLANGGGGGLYARVLLLLLLCVFRVLMGED